MSKKYDMRICKCGRIHMVDNNSIDKALKNEKDILLVCGGCGNAILIGADIGVSWDDCDEECYTMYSCAFSSYKDKIITSAEFESTENHKGIEEIIYSHGLKVPMMSGMYATDYYNGIFSDRWYPDFYKIRRKDITVEKIMAFIEQYHKDRQTVNMNRFISETPEDMIEEISHYYIKGFNWAGTKWETDWNK